MPNQDSPVRFLVTGANRGIGLAFARALSARGDSVVATARQPEKARDLVKLDLRVEQLDVADEKSISALARRLAGDPLDVLINNAGIGDAGPSFSRLSMKDLEQAFRVNSIGPVAVAQTLLPNLRAGTRRTIVNLSSGLGSISQNTSGGWIAYRASKAALNQLTRAMAAELKKDRFICIAICPGWVQTDMGGHGATLSPDASVAAMLKVLDGLTPSDTGRFLDRRGKEVPW
jgi:NAD(P)-dependent dehydrogenase (short-subunit alcohol dehydrogenase family)